MKYEFSAGGVVFKTSPVIPAKAGIQEKGTGSRISPKGTSFFEAAKSGMTKKPSQNDIQILVSQHSGHHGWVFPKGFIGDKEEFKGQSKEETALREVKEETGIIGKIVEPLTPIMYWYSMDGEKRRKTVYYFIMSEMGGDITKHDWEMENVEWLQMDKVMDRLTYDSDKKVWEEAEKKIVSFLRKRAIVPFTGESI